MARRILIRRIFVGRIVSGMKKFNNVQYSLADNCVFLKFADFSEELRIIDVSLILDVSRDDVPLGLELFNADDIGRSNLLAIVTALSVGDFKYSNDEELNILTINFNAVDEYPITQRPGSVKFGFTGDGKLVTMVIR